MAGSDSRRALTIRLAREGRTLLRTFERAEPPRPAFDEPQRLPLLPAIEAIARTLDQGTADEIAGVLSGDGAASAGEALFQVLFGADADFLALLRDLTGDPSADARKHPLRVRVVTADPLFAGLPFRLTARAGERLEGLGFTFETTHEAALRPPPPLTWNRVFVLAEGTAPPERVPLLGLFRSSPTALRDVRFPPRAAPPRILIVAPVIAPSDVAKVAAPGAPPPPALDTEAHVRAVRDGLAAIGLPHDHPAFVRVVRTAEDLAQALVGMKPDVIHALAYLDVDALVLEARSGGATRLALAELGRWLAAAPPLVLTLAGCSLGACSFPAAFAALAPHASLAVVHRTGAWSDSAAPAVLHALLAALGSDGDPVIAIRDAGKPTTMAVHGAHARWICDEPPRLPSPFALACSRALDAPRADALARVATLSRADEARVLALILPEPPRALGTSGSRPLIEELDLAGRHLGRVRAVPLPLIEGKDPLVAWRSALHTGLDVGATIEEALRRLALDAGWAPIGGAAPEPAPPAFPADRATFVDRPGERGLLWLDSGTRGAAPHHPMSTADLTAWLEVAAGVLAPRVPPEIRVVWSIAIELDPDQRERLEAWLASRQRGRKAVSPGFDVALLPPARPLDRDDVRSCLEEAWPEPCPAPQLDHAAGAVLEHAHGELDATLALVARAHATSWAALLRGLDETEAPAEEDIFS